MLISIIITIIIIVLLIACIFWVSAKLNGGLHTSIKKYVKDDKLDNRIKSVIDAISNEINDVIIHEYINSKNNIDDLLPNIVDKLMNIDNIIVKEGLIFNVSVNYDLNVRSIPEITETEINIDKNNIQNILQKYIEIVSNFIENENIDISQTYNLIKFTLLALIEYLTICYYTSQLRYIDLVEILSYTSSYNLVLKLGTAEDNKIFRMRYPSIVKERDAYGIINTDYLIVDDDRSFINEIEYDLHRTCRKIYANSKLRQYLPKLYMSSFDYEFMESFNHCIWCLEDEYEPISINLFMNDNMVRKYAQTLCNILKYLHKMKLYYGDWKIANLMITKDNNFILTDFDISSDQKTVISTYGIFGHQIGIDHPKEIKEIDTAIAFFDVFNICRCKKIGGDINDYAWIVNKTKDDADDRIKFKNFNEFCDLMPKIITDKISEYKNYTLLENCINLFAQFKKMKVFKMSYYKYIANVEDEKMNRTYGIRLSK